MKILNLYAGIGGNRKLWGNDHKITAVELDYDIAKVYQHFFPKDEMCLTDAHDFLLNHFKEFDFIWSSPPCPTHSHIRKELGVMTGQSKATFPDMKLYEEILFLQHYFKGKYVVENVISFYKPLIIPQEINKHYFWTNFFINPLPVESRQHKTLGGRKILETRKGFLLDGYSGFDKRKALRNCVEPETGLHIFQEAFREYKTLL